jgi:hypothetical protein
MTDLLAWAVSIAMFASPGFAVGYVMGRSRAR